MKCVHGRRKSRCVECGGVGICSHGIRKRRCAHHNNAGYLHCRIGNRIRSALKKNKDLSTIEYLGCDIKTLKAHIESQFTEGMSWDSDIHLDHIIPVCYGFPTDAEKISRLHYTNLQPLFAKDNLVKGHRWIG